MSQNPFCAKSTFYAKWEEQSAGESMGQNKAGFYGKKVTNYTKGSRIYRIFYIDTEGKFGERNLIYLKADNTNEQTSWGNLESLSSYTSADKKVQEKMNSIWWASERGQGTEYVKEKFSWYLNAPTGTGYSKSYWSSYYDESKAKYALGSPSADLYCASYNDVTHPIRSSETEPILHLFLCIRFRIHDGWDQVWICHE